MKILFLRFFLILPFLIFSQDLKVDFSKSKIFEDKYKNTSVLFSETDAANNLVIVRSFEKSNKDFVIQTYDSNLNLLKDFKFEIKRPHYEKYSTFLGIVYLNEAISIVEIFFDLKVKDFVCQATTVDSKDNISKKELFRISKTEVDKIGTIGIERSFYEFNLTYNNYGEFDGLKSIVKNIVMKVNDAKTGFVIGLDFNSYNNKVLNLYVYDKDLNLNYKKSFEKKIADRKYVFQNLQISPDAKDIYLLAKSYLTKNFLTGEYKYELTKFTKDSQLSQTFGDSKKNVNSLKLIHQNDQLVSIGFYSSGKENRYEGVCYYSFDTKTLTRKASKYNPFSKEFMFDKYGDKNPKALKNVVFRNVFMSKNNELILNAEEYYARKSSLMSNATIPGLQNSSTEYHYDDIISVKIDAAGNLIWSRVINKNQVTQRDDSVDYLSYSSTFVNDNNYIFINAGEKIKKLRNDRIEFDQVRKNKTNLVLIKINANGDYDYEELLNNEENEVPIKVSEGMILGNSLIFLGQKGRDKQLLKVNLE
jgi:hypothetical protein